MTRIVSCALLLAAAFAADPIATGSWTLSGDVMGYPIDEKCTLVQTDAAISGTCNDGAKDRATTGTVKDTTITFSHPSEYEGSPLTLTYTGKLDSTGKVTGTIDVQPMNVGGTFTLTKSAPPAPKP